MPILALAAAPFLMAAGGARIPVPGGNGKIAWSRVVAGNAEIFVMDPDGGAQTNITNNPAQDFGAAWSPDQNKIAFSTNRDGNYEIYVMNADGSNPTRLTNNSTGDFQPAWSPDGSKIAFMSVRDGNQEIYVMTANGGDQRNLTHAPGNDQEPAWSPDGSLIAFTSDRDANYEVYLMHRDGGGQTNITKNLGADTEPNWSPDGKKLAFVSNRGGNADIYVMDATGLGVRNISNAPDSDLGPAWSPDGTKIVFTALRHGQDEIYVMNADGGGQTRLTVNPTSDFLPDWQPLVSSPGPFLPAPPQAPPTGAPPGAGPPSFLTIADSAVTEGNTIVFVVTLSPPASETVTVNFLTNDGTAKGIEDYVPRSGSLVFAPGETTKIIPVTTILDSVAEPNEVFLALLAVPINAVTADGVAFGKITTQRLPYLGHACITEFSSGFVGHPGGLVLAPDGNFWGTEQLDAKLAKFDPRTLTATEYALPPGTFPHFIMVGPDGNLWFTALDDKLGTFDLKTNTATLFAGITRGSVPHYILLAPDGAFYFSEQAAEPVPEPGAGSKIPGNGRLARFDPRTRALTEYFGLLPPGNRIHGLTVGPDGNVWACLEGFDQLARFNLTTQSFDRFVNFSEDSGPHDVLVGPDGNFYVVLQDANRLGRYNPTTGEVKEFPVPGLSVADGPSVVFLTVSHDKRFLWFSEFLNDRVGRFELATEQFTEYFSGIAANGAPIGIVVGPDDNLWFTEAVLDTRIPGRMARLVLLGPESPPCVSIEPALISSPAPAVVHFDAVFPGGRSSVKSMRVTANGVDITSQLQSFVTISTDTTWSATISNPTLPANTRSTIVFTVETTQGSASDTLVIDSSAAAQSSDLLPGFGGGSMHAAHDH